jgi:hypothetical protein
MVAGAGEGEDARVTLGFLSHTIDSRLSSYGVVWIKGKEAELQERAEREIGGSVAEELGKDEPST